MSERLSSGLTSLIKVFTPSFADESDTNAQNLTVKEVVARLDPQRFLVTMFYDQVPDERVASRPNTRLWKWKARGNTALTLVKIARNTPDVYFFPREGPLDKAFIRCRNWFGWRSALVTYLVSGGLDRFPPREGQLQNLHAADAAFANCRYLTGLLKEKLGIEAGTIHDGIDRRFYFPPSSPRKSPGHPTVLFAGSFRAYKRADIVIKEAARWPGVRFRMAGTGEEEQCCRALACELGCANVSFLGHVNQARLGEEMRSADLFLFPSELEGHPQVLLQAAGCGLPVIAMKSYRPDSVADGVTGFLVQDEQELEEKLDLLLKDGELRLRMSEAAAKHARQFSWEVAADEWARVFEAVSARRAP